MSRQKVGMTRCRTREGGGAGGWVEGEQVEQVGEEGGGGEQGGHRGEEQAGGGLEDFE